MKRFPYFFAISDELNIQLALSNSNLKGKKSFELKRKFDSQGKEISFELKRKFDSQGENISFELKKVRFSREKNRSN